MKKLSLLLGALVLIVVTGCSSSAESGGSEGGPLKVGVTAGPHEDVMKKVKEVAEKDGFEIEVVAFNDYVMPNKALDEGELDANVFQHEPYLTDFVEERGMELSKVATTINFPMGIYSDQYDDLDNLKKGDKVGLPNHSTGEPRALMLFEEAGIIELKDGVGVEATIKDIEKNPLNLEFVPLEASQIPRQLGELAIAAINTNYAMESGRVPTEDSLVMEPEDSPWVNVIATKTENKDDERINKLVDYYHSDEVKQFIEEEFNGSVVASW
ncbi:MetQ/NlpA family ABC transporter substrate-binding protein [Guptibacillus algicola]|uniref:MetQ/NlpA family ABC transporter substrate-binding protein n=1 Tax=Guptibacillus algicola TaxID=225844 RepID=UPI001CD712EE|nr:MetQ/NlpA family ABC transporter substrate-binding protein [Alkalihalobacillus algicola]MCA0986910.1 MetQ/NlpA family ABC transporter substrate-binding protein [Alkalihalobacillus algicola]